MARQAGVIVGMLILAHAAAAQFTQQGGKLVGTGAVGTARQARSVAISADGNTAIVGGYLDNSYAGATWVYTRSGGVWSQQGSKLVGNDTIGTNVQQGYSVAISSDGNTAIVGGYLDNSSVGAAWVYTRSGGVWSQQGSKLVGTGVVGTAWQGTSVAIAADGNTAIVGGFFDNSQAGAVWVYTRSGGVWSQQGSKLVGTGAVGAAWQGRSVAISADGNTAFVGGPSDNSSAGAVWVYTRSGGVWSQQGSKLVGTGAVGAAGQGGSVTISADGNTAIVGGYNDNSGAGAAWVYTRSGGVWTQQGSKLVGAGAVGASWQGNSVAISADGNTAFVGGPGDNSLAGAAWVYTRSGGVWSQQGTKLVGTGAVGAAWQGGSVAISGDGTTAIVGGPIDNSFAGAAWVFFSPAAASQLAFVQQPTTTTAGQTIIPAVTVQLEDSGGNPVAQGNVTIAMSLSSGTGTLGGALSQVTNASGLATFNNLSVDLVGSKQLTASSASVTSAVSNPFTITGGAAAGIPMVGGLGLLGLALLVLLVGAIVLTRAPTAGHA